MKNIVICCDGTDNKLSVDANTNVLHLYSCLKHNKEQVTYYHPGVGTIPKKKYRLQFMKTLSILHDQMSAGSIDGHVNNAYKFLMDNYEEGDKIFLFGFSRGAYTVRMLTGMLEMFGLLLKGNDGHLKYIQEIYAKKDEEESTENYFKTGNKFKKRFSRKITIDFLGIWDTVMAVGNPFSFYKQFPNSESPKIVKVIRHAIAIDERRKHYSVELIKPKGDTDLMEVYFAGVHSDVGGSYPDNESGLAKCALEWMLGEASTFGLMLIKDRVDRYLGFNPKDYSFPNAQGSIHNSLTCLFKVLDFMPRVRYDKTLKRPFFDWRLWPLRDLPKDAFLHSSVNERIKRDPNYRPKNLHDSIFSNIIENKKILYY